MMDRYPPRQIVTPATLAMPSSGSESNDEDQLLRSLAWITIATGIAFMIGPAFSVMPWISFFFQPNARRTLGLYPILILSQLLLTLCFALSGIILALAGVQWARRSGDPGRLLRWGAAGLLAGILFQTIHDVVFHYPREEEFSAGRALSLVMEYATASLIPLFLFLLSRNRAMRDFFSGFQSAGIAGPEDRVSEWQLVPMEPESTSRSPQPLAYFRPVGGGFAMPVESILRWLGKGAQVLGVVYLIRFLGARRIGETFTFARTLFDNPRRAASELIDLARLPCGLMLVLAGVGGSRLRPGVRRWVIVAATMTLALVCLTGLEAHSYSFFFSLLYAVLTMRRIASLLTQEILFLLLLILVFRHRVAEELLPARSDGRHWWETTR